MKKIISDFSFGNTQVFYLSDSENTGLVILPKGYSPVLTDNDMRPVDPLVQIKLIDDAYPSSFGNGTTMLNSETVSKLVFERQELISSDESETVVSYLKSPEITVKHTLIWRKGYETLETFSTVTNSSDVTIGVEMFASFCLGMLSPLDDTYKPNKLRIHRLRGRWSQECKIDSRMADDFLLSPTKAGAVDAYSVRFGERGNKTSNVYNPFIAVEDTEYGIFWGAQLLIDGSWQMEMFNKYETLCVAGGLADYDFGHWYKNIEPGCDFTSPAAFLSVCKGDIDKLCYQLTDIQRIAEETYPENEKDLPVMFNEWCSSWGNPSRENVLNQIKALKGRGFKYYVIDAGWYKDDECVWDELTGDWIPSKKKYPNGIKEVTDAIRDAGMVPGIWCEIETCAEKSQAYQLKDHLLTKFGKQIRSGKRKYWDFRDPWTINYLTERMVNLLESANFGYLKIDSNECCGIGCDGAESLGEGLRQNLECFNEFVKGIQKRLPHLVIENCSSGGMRVTPKQSLMYPIFSGSDSFECSHGPIVFANNQRVALPRQNQVWCTVRPDEDNTKLIYKLSAAFLGRMCLSGNIEALCDEQQEIIDDGIAKYRKAVPVIKNGFSKHYGPEIKSYTVTNGWQAVVRKGTESNELLVVFHSFDYDVPEIVEIDLSECEKLEKDWDIMPQFLSYCVDDGKLRISNVKPGVGCVIMLKTY